MDRNEAAAFALLRMARMIFSDFRRPAAEQAYEIAFDYLGRSGVMRDEFEACIFLTQRLMAMIEDGQTNKIRMANRAISEYQRHVAQCGSSVRFADTVDVDANSGGPWP